MLNPVISKRIGDLLESFGYEFSKNNKNNKMVDYKSLYSLFSNEFSQFISLKTGVHIQTIKYMRVFIEKDKIKNIKLTNKNKNLFLEVWPGLKDDLDKVKERI